jgi:methionine sulfoxide reductase heme-binding subunit
VILLAASNTKALWYLTRGTGAVTLVLLTLSVALGVADVRRLATPRIPRFVIDGLHRTVSLLVVLMVAIHVATTLLDSYVSIRLVDAFVPFVSSYRPIWLGLGALALDLLIALIVTSLLRARLGQRGWRAVHWLAYACWPVAFVHALGTGSDIHSGGSWMLAVSLACAAVVAVAVLARVVAGWPDQVRPRLAALGGLVGLGGFVALWLPSGPLAAGWARRAGTPASAIASTGSVTAPRAAATVPAAAHAPAASTTTSPVTATLTGRVHESVDAAGTALVRFALALDRGPWRALEVDLRGQALAGGGVSLSAGHVSLGTPSDATRFQGAVASLQGGHLTASLRDRRGGAGLDLAADLQVDTAAGHVGGQATLQPAAGAGG